MQRERQREWLATRVDRLTSNSSLLNAAELHSNSSWTLALPGKWLIIYLTRSAARGARTWCPDVAKRSNFFFSFLSLFASLRRGLRWNFQTLSSTQRHICFTSYFMHGNGYFMTDLFHVFSYTRMYVSCCIHSKKEIQSIALRRRKKRRSTLGESRGEKSSHESGGTISVDDVAQIINTAIIDNKRRLDDSIFDSSWSFSSKNEVLRKIRRFEICKKISNSSEIPSRYTARCVNAKKEKEKKYEKKKEWKKKRNVDATWLDC